MLSSTFIIDRCNNNNMIKSMIKKMKSMMKILMEMNKFNLKKFHLKNKGMSKMIFLKRNIYSLIYKSNKIYNNKTFKRKWLCKGNI